MGKQIVKQPNGMFAIWSSVVDDFVVIDCEDASEIIDAFVEESRQQITDRVNGIVASLERNEKPYHQHTLSFDDCVEQIQSVHGKNSESLRMLGLST